MGANQAIDAPQLRTLLLRVCEAVRAREQEFNALDSAIGDGDHGITMRVGFDAISKQLTSLPADAGIGALLGGAGKAFMRSAGGAIGVIMGRALMAAGSTVAGAAQLGPAELKQCFNAMERAVAETGKAKPGDKTLLDALHAAAQSASAASDDISARDLLSLAAYAAEQAAQDTAGMHCRVGRASRLGDRALGHPDPGAVSFALIVRTLADGTRQDGA
jgi:dihydroxyacetone kinase-like protein